MTGNGQTISPPVPSIIRVRFATAEEIEIRKARSHSVWQVNGCAAKEALVKGEILIYHCQETVVIRSSYKYVCGGWINLMRCKTHVS